ncbi:TonB-dependent receptor [Dysgonomonas sp. 520]|uniref:SusC/RagA family TonB-linked outer membrane protein n=1 Tax=Dysgonomonas sp. 520 TaxID=2302931 RepID=UPI0013D6E4FB|nr:TonB-dependent receptor [Dysgonomonas sp. 520]NDW08222.1 TonB-dependent receptor [Dysgonomonas sp. 520]
MNSIRIFCKVFLLFICIGISAQTNEDASLQQKTITGTIIDNNGEPVIGATVRVKDSKTGTVTDFDGKYSIKASPKDKLVVSYLGYSQQEVDVKNNTQIDMTLQEDSKTLDELVVIGYGSVKKSNLTIATSNITSEAIEGRPVTNLSQLFSGQLAGIQAQTSSGLPGEDMQITIRGNNSLNSSSTPLYVIDGVITESMNDVNPSDVASIQILKDAASTSIYGARGSNGVVLIETKRAKEGVTTVTFDASYGFQQADRLPEVMSPREWFAYNIWMINAQYLNKGGTNSMSIPNKLRPEGDRIPEAWLLNPQSDTPDWRLNPDVPQTDWVDAILRTAPMQNYQLSIASTGKMGSINLSGGYLSTDGIVKNTGFQRINFRLNATLNVTDKLKFGGSFAPSFSKQQRGESEGKDKVILTALQYPPLMSMDKGTVELGFDPAYPNNVNPYERLKSVTDDMDVNRFNTSVWGEYKFIPQLVFKSILNYNSRSTTYEYFVPENVVAPNATGGQISSGSGYSETYDNWGIQNVLTYDNTFLKNHNVNLMLGQSADEIKRYRANVAASGFPLESVPTLNMGTIPTNASTIRYTVRTSSFFGRLSYDYAGKYLFTASFRYDGSSRFGSGNRWAFFPSFSGGWKINEENFMKNIKQINLLKLRASWGMSGNDQIGYNDYLSTFDVTNAVYGNTAQVGMYPKNLANPDLKWETTKATNLGFDLSLFKNRVQFNFDYYINKTEDLLFNLSVPATTGFTTMRTNTAAVENRGWEIDLTTKNIDTKNFSWSTTLNLSKTKDKVLDMGDNDNLITEKWYSHYITRVGGPISQFYLLRTDGLLTENDFGVGPDGKYDRNQPLVPVMNNQIPGNLKFVDQNEDGKIDENDRVPYGNNTPDLIFGFTNRFSYKNFDFSIFLQGQLGGDVFYLASRNINAGRRFNNSLVDWLHCYKETYRGGDPIPHELGVDMSWDGKTPLPYGLGANGVNENTVTDQRIYDATYLKIKNIYLGYTLPESALKKLGIRKLKVYGTIENLCTFTDYVGNPDVNSYEPNNPLVRGVDYSTYPLTRTYTIGLNLTF